MEIKCKFVDEMGTLAQLESTLTLLESRIAKTREFLLQEQANLDDLQESIGKILSNNPNPKVKTAAAKVTFNFDEQPAKCGPLKSSMVLVDSTSTSFCTTPAGQCAHISDGEFESIPKYMKGRMTRERINTAIDALNRLYSEKYAIMRLNPAKMSPEQRQKYHVFMQSYAENFFPFLFRIGGKGNVRRFLDCILSLSKTLRVPPWLDHPGRRLRSRWILMAVQSWPSCVT